MQVRIRVVPAASIPAATLTAQMAVWKTAIENTWGNRSSVVRPGERLYPLTFEVLWVGGSKHRVLNISPGAGRENKGR
jgi:hypothetical protein